MTLPPAADLDAELASPYGAEPGEMGPGTKTGRSGSQITNQPRSSFLASAGSMLKTTMLSFVGWALLPRLAVAAAKCTPYLTATALSSEPDGIARIECWQFLTPLHSYPTVGAALTVANTTNVTYVVLPPRSSEGIHKPPHPMLFVLISGLAHITLPYGDDEAWIMEGVNGLLVANDVTGEGHFTDYPSDKETVALQLPFDKGRIPSHKVLHRGVCNSSSGQIRQDCGDEASETRQEVSDAELR